MLHIEHYSKTYPGGKKAVDDLTLHVRPGQIYGFIGHNGAGKTTTLRAVAGVMDFTEGTITIDGHDIKKAPVQAKRVTAFLPDNPDIYEFMKGIDYLNFIADLYDISAKQRTADIGKYSDAFELTDNLGSPIGSYSHGMRQKLALISAFIRRPRLLILDEPTSSLTEKETARLFDLVKELSGRGISILYISHRMAEIFEICDRVTVFKDGTYVTTMDTGDICADDIIRAMVGRELGNLYPTKSSCIAADDPVLEVNGLTGSIFRGVSFALRRGEILGFAGLVGAGRSEVMRGLCAIDPIRSGQVVLNGRPCAFHTYRDAVDAGICYLTEDRKTQGLFLEMSIKNNMSSANMKGVSHGIWLDDKLERSLANRFVEQLAIKIPGIEYPISSLSGGNQQKCLIGKWLSLAPKVIIMDEPTRGIDVGAKREIHALLRQLAESGVGVIVVSSELPEVIGVSDRVAVMHEGCLAGFLEGEEVTEENIMKLASGEQLAEKELRQ